MREREGTAVILYDGVCGLCNRGVRLVLKHDREGVFRFASLQSSAGREILARHGIEPDALDTFYVVREFGLAGERVLSRSSAAIYAAGEAGRGLEVCDHAEGPAATRPRLCVRHDRPPSLPHVWEV